MEDPILFVSNEEVAFGTLLPLPETLKHTKQTF